VPARRSSAAVSRVTGAPGVASSRTPARDSTTVKLSSESSPAGERAPASIVPDARSALTSAARERSPLSTVRRSSVSKRRYTKAPTAISTTASAAANASVT